MTDQPRSVTGGRCFILKFWLDRIYSFGDTAVIFISSADG